MSRALTLFMIAGILATGCCQARAQQVKTSPEKSNRGGVPGTKVVAPDGAAADGTRVFVGRGESITLMGSGKKIGELIPEDGHGSTLVLTQSSGSIDIDAAIDREPASHDSVDGDAAGFTEDMGEMHDSMMGMGYVPSRSAFYYASHPDHGFAFVPTQAAPPRTIRLRPPATLQVRVPRRYRPDGYVVLACWMNRYADPISPRPIQTGDAITLGMDNDYNFPGMSGMEMGVDYGGGSRPTDSKRVSEPLRGWFSDWRLRTMVTHWVVAEIEDREPGSTTNQATVVLPPGEVRVTLVPKAIVERHKDDAVELERLLFFGGPTKIVLTESDAPGVHVRLTILPSEAVRDIEITGRSSVSGMPDWTEERNDVFLTPYVAGRPERVTVGSDRGAMSVAESRRSDRSTLFLGRLAHRIGRDRYLAVGLPVDKYHVWSIAPTDRPAVAQIVKSCGYIEGSRALQPLSVQMVNSTQTPQRGTAAAAILPTTDKYHQRRLYRIFPAAASPQRYLIDLTRPAVFKAVDPNIDPFTAKTLPNVEVGVVSEQKLQRERPQAMHAEMGMGMGMEMSESMDLEEMSIDPASAAGPPPERQPNVEDLRRRIEKLDKDLKRAKELLRQITGQQKKATPKR